MLKAIATTSILLTLLPAGVVHADSTDGASRVIDLQWTVAAEGIPADAGRADLWIALPRELPEQQVTDLVVETDLPWSIVEDLDFGNRTARVTVDSPGTGFSVTLRAKLTRRAVTAPQPATLSEAQRDLYLRETALVSLSPRVRTLTERIGNDPRARYDYVLASMNYDKTAPGWGQGDTERACDVGLGNCTDFHSLFMSLSRAAGVPAVFEMGYSILPEGETARAGGYHCWAWFHDGEAWVPVDISEADKHPEKAEFFYGHLDADRITFSRGRDVRLPGMSGPPLNYLPSGGYLEVDGTPAGSVSRTLSYTVSAKSGS
jgi:hypothetical protein